MGVNYGANKIRFPSPVPVGAKLRLGVKLLSVEDIAGGAQVTMEFTFEVEGAAKPSLRRRGHLSLLPVGRVAESGDGGLFERSGSSSIHVRTRPTAAPKLNARSTSRSGPSSHPAVVMVITTPSVDWMFLSTAE